MKQEMSRGIFFPSRTKKPLLFRVTVSYFVLFSKSKCQMSELQMSEFQLSEFRQKHKNELNDPIVIGPRKCPILSHFLSVSVKCPNFDCPNLDSKNGGLSKITQWCVNVPGVYVMMG